jgi:hypothetical protein
MIKIIAPALLIALFQRHNLHFEVHHPGILGQESDFCGFKKTIPRTHPPQRFQGGPGLPRCCLGPD